jgi:hypothetical protein
MFAHLEIGKVCGLPIGMQNKKKRNKKQQKHGKYE